MKPYFYFSAAGHAVFLTLVVVWATLFSKPRMSYYAVDIISGSPAPSAAPAVESPPVETPAEPEAPAKPEPKSVIKEAIKVIEKERPKPPKPTPRPTPPKPKPSITGALSSLTGSAPAATMSANPGQTGASVSAEASGSTFPYPWYLKTIADKLDQVWKPEGEQSCQVKFIIARDGSVSGVAVSKSSGDAYFDQLAIRAVQNASPMPPLPNGYPEATLRVFMKFIAKN